MAETTRNSNHVAVFSHVGYICNFTGACLIIQIQEGCMTPTTLHQQGTILDIFCYHLHTGKDGSNWKEMKDEQTTFISITCKPKTPLEFFFFRKVCNVVHMNIHTLYKGETATHSKESFHIWCKMATLNFTTDIHKHLPH